MVVMNRLKIISISDTHGLHKEVCVPKSDLLVHTGDFCNWGTLVEIIDFANWFMQQDARYKICIAGNHDLYVEKNPEMVRNIFKERGIIYLQDELVEINGFKIYGSPFTPLFCDWAFMLPRDEIYNKKWSKIPEDVDILLTHGPAYNILDGVNCHRSRPELGQEHVGCKGLLDRIMELPNLKLHICGHIHGAYGKKVVKSADNKRKITMINASVCTEDYEPLNSSIKINL